MSEQGARPPRWPRPSRVSTDRVRRVGGRRSTTSASTSSLRQARRSAPAVPPNRSASSPARRPVSGSTTRTSAAPRATRFETHELGRLAGADHEHAGVVEANPAPRAPASAATDADRGGRLADGGLGAHAARRSRWPTRRAARGSAPAPRSDSRQGQRLAHLAEDLGLARHERVEAGRDAVEVPRRRARRGRCRRPRRHRVVLAGDRSQLGDARARPGASASGPTRYSSVRLQVEIADRLVGVARRDDAGRPGSGCGRRQREALAHLDRRGAVRGADDDDARVTPSPLLASGRSLEAVELAPRAGRPSARSAHM